MKRMAPRGACREPELSPSRLVVLQVVADHAGLRDVRAVPADDDRNVYFRAAIVLFGLLPRKSLGLSPINLTQRFAFAGVLLSMEE